MGFPWLSLNELAERNKNDAKVSLKPDRVALTENFIE